MSMAAQLREATRVPLAVGQRVIVRRGRDVVVDGWIREVNLETHSIRVSNNVSGTDQQVDVDPKRYTIYVQDRDPPAVGYAQGAATYIRHGRPGYRSHP